MDVALTGRADRGYQLARKHTAPRDGGGYPRFPRPGHLLVWADKLGASLVETLRLFGYDVREVLPTATVVGNTDMVGAIQDVAPEVIAVTDAALKGTHAVRVLAPLPTFALSANALAYWRPLDAMARYVTGRLCVTRRTADAPRRLAWIVDAPGPGAPCTYSHGDGSVLRTTLHSCEPVHTVAHHIGAP